MERYCFAKRWAPLQSGKQTCSGVHLKTISAQSGQRRWGGCCLADKPLPGASDLEEVLQSELQVVEYQAFEAKIGADNERTLGTGEPDFDAASITPHQVVAQ